jgi:serine/threonine-protein kinase
MHADLPSTIGGHRVERELGAGGMGKVYLCRDEALDRAVAIKVLLPDMLEQADMRARFLREARALARVSSPHVVLVHAVGEDAAVGPYVVMEYLEGEDLQARLLRAGALHWREAVPLCRDAIAGLKAAQQAGIVHRDVKPANLFVVAGRVKITDFGLAREIQGHATVTQAGLVVGTPAYLAPEVIRGNPATHASDLYALGATLFHLVAGHPPFRHEAPLEVLAAAIREEAPRLSTRENVPPELDDLVARMLAKDPAQRPPHWDALDAELARLIDGAVPATKTMTFASPPPPPAQQSAAESAGDVLASAVSAVSHSSLPTMEMQLAAPRPSTTSAPALTSGEHVKIKTQSLTVMMTDIAGYTERTSRVSREESARWLALHDTLLQPIFRAFSGKVVKTIGDAFLVTFASPTDAVHCACAIQDRLWQHNLQCPPEDSIRVRIALSAGEVRLHKGDVFGEAVNLAARIEGLAEAGEVLLSDAVYSTMNVSEVPLEPRGEQTLKGIARPVAIYAAKPEGSPGAPPFGGRALARVKESRVDALVAQAPVALAKVGPLASALKSAVLRPQNRKIVLAAALAIFVVVVVALVIARLGDNRLERIRAGQASAVLDELQQIKDDEKTGLDWALVGHARVALGARDKAFGAYKKALDAGYVDDDMRNATFTSLEDKAEGGAVELLVAWPDDSNNARLEKLLKGDAWWPRHHAMKVLEERKLLTDAQREEVALLDVTSSECQDRRYGLGLLKRYGKSEAALQAVRKLGADPLRNACLMFETGAAEAAIKKRSVCTGRWRHRSESAPARACRGRRGRATEGRRAERLLRLACRLLGVGPLIGPRTPWRETWTCSSPCCCR